MPAAVPTGDSSTDRRRRTEVLILVCAAQFMIVLDIAVVNVALPSIRNDLGFSATGLQWVVNAYTLALGGLLLLGGRAGDLLGRRRMFLTGLFLFTLASLLGGLAQDEATLIAARALQGLGGAIVAPSTLAILTTTFREGAERTRAFAAWGAVAGAGGSTGGLIGGILTDALSWRWILFVNVPIGALLIWRARRDLPHDAAPAAGASGAGSFDVAGALTATVGLVALVFGIVRTEAVGWGSVQTIGALAVGVALLAAFVTIEARIARAPLVPLRIFSFRQLTAANVAMFLLAGAMFAIWFFLSLYFQEVLGYSPIETGLAFLPLAVGMALGSSQAGKVVARIGIRATLATGFLASTVGIALFSRIRPDGTFAVDVLGPSIVVAIGMGLCLVPLTQASVSGVPRHEAGLASGLINVSRQVGGALGLAVLATVATSRTGDMLAAVHGRPSVAAVDAALTSGYRRAFELAAALTLAGTLMILALVRERPAPTTAGGAAGTAVEPAEPVPAPVRD